MTQIQLPDNKKRITVVSKASINIEGGSTFHYVVDKDKVEEIILAPDHVRILKSNNERSLFPMNHIVKLDLTTEEKVVDKSPEEMEYEAQASTEASQQSSA